jgi:hypothetical protein
VAENGSNFYYHLQMLSEPRISQYIYHHLQLQTLIHPSTLIPTTFKKP